MILRIFGALVMTALLSSSLSAQRLLSPFFSFSTKKVSYITMKDGTDVEARLIYAKYKKGLVEEIKIKTDDGEKIKIAAEDIQSMYLPPQGFEKFNKSMESAFDATNYGTGMNKEIVEKGYIYYEQSEAQVGKKKMVVLMQLLSPHLGSDVKVYFDPWAKESMGVSVGGFKVAGGNAKSYYVKKGDDVAYRLKKKDYDEQFESLFGGCDAIERTDGKPRWLSLAEHVYTNNVTCAGETGEK